MALPRIPVTVKSVDISVFWWMYKKVERRLTKKRRGGCENGGTHPFTPGRWVQRTGRTAEDPGSALQQASLSNIFRGARLERILIKRTAENPQDFLLESEQAAGGTARNRPVSRARLISPG